MPTLTHVPGISYATLIEPEAPRSTRALCTLWRPPSKVADPSAWAVIGPCYSLAGVGLLVRTLLANPWIDELHIGGPDLTGTGAALWELLAVAPSSVSLALARFGLADIDLLAFDAWLEGLTVVAASDLAVGLRVIDKGARSEGLPGERPAPVICPPAPIEPRDEGLPGLPGSVSVVGETMAGVWFGVLDEVMRHGAVSPTSYGQDQREILALSWSIDKPTVMSHSDILDYDALDRYAFEHFISYEPPPGVAYTYGDRMRRRWGNQIGRVVRMLEQSPGQRRCWVSLWDPAEGLGEKSPPCLVGCWFRVDHTGALNLWACFRSHDLLRAWPSNVRGLAVLLDDVACDIGLEIGTLSGVSLSAHVYADGWAQAAELGRKRRRAPQDARGNVVVEPIVEQGVLWLRATWLTPAGEALDTVKARTDRDLLAGIRRKRWVTSVDHALWLGAEVARVWRERGAR